MCELHVSIVRSWIDDLQLQLDQFRTISAIDVIATMTRFRIAAELFDYNESATTDDFWEVVGLCEL